ncbi:hypothetical protein AVEN_166607-1, partial [Araneus ventricosus]
QEEKTGQETYQGAL